MKYLAIDCWVLIGLLVFGFLQAQEPPASTGTAPAKVLSAQEDRPADREGIRSTSKSLIEAFEKGDAAQVASMLTEGAELMTDDAPPLRGKKGIQDALSQNFSKKQKLKMVLEVESVRFPSRDTAIEEGHLISSVNQQAATSKKYSLMYVREDGKWLISLIREWPSEEAPLRDLEWLIGRWQAKRDDLAIDTTYEWLGNKAFIRGNIITRQKDRTVSAMQVIGLDPQSGALRIWVFEANGIFVEGSCQRDQNAWIFETSGKAPDGDEVVSKNILYRVNQDTMTWQPVQLRKGLEQIADLPPIKVTRTSK